MTRIAVFPGSFDPITRGHESIIRRGLAIFDEIIVAIGENPEKSFFFPVEKRIKWLHEVFGNEPGIRILKYDGLTVNFCRQMKSGYILRGLRTSADFEFERAIGHMNKSLYPDVETVFLLAPSEYAAISSSIVRDIYKNGGEISQFIPEGIQLDEKI
jgi:pantetheine-phosphate adenylyltransferase